MVVQPDGGLRRFFQTRVGRVVLVAISTLLVLGTFAYVTPLLAIPVFLVMGLAFPIILGLKRPRFLAVSGLVVLLVVAPVATAAFSEQILVPVGAASSAPSGAFGSGGSVLQQAAIAPFSGDASTNFTWAVTVDPSHLPSYLNGTNWSNDTLILYISNCPGATTLNEAYCPSGYELRVVNQSLPNLTTPTSFEFHTVIGSNGIWSWQLGLKVQNPAATNYTNILLAGDPTYNGIEGPVVGGFWVVYSALIFDIFITAFLYLGLPFYFLLLLYMMLKNRERRRQELSRMDSGSIPPTSARAPQSASGSGDNSQAKLDNGSEIAAAAPLSGERTCPSCAAVVYPSEKTCWKCGTSLST